MGAGAVLVTGGIGWWARYVTAGASKISRLHVQVDEMRKSIEDHEHREEEKFEQVGQDVAELQKDITTLVGSVGQLHGKVDGLTTLLKSNGGPRRARGGKDA